MNLNPTPLTCDNFRCFSSNSTKLSVVILLAFYTYHLLDVPMDACWLEKAKCYIFEIPPKNQGYFSIISKDQKHEICLRNTL